VDWRNKGETSHPRDGLRMPPNDVWPALRVAGAPGAIEVRYESAQSVRAAQFVGLVIMDQCPVTGVEVLSPSVSVRPIGSLDPQPWERLVSTVIGRPGLATYFGGRAEYRAAHPCGVLQIELPSVPTIAKARMLLERAAPSWVLALVLRFGATFEPFADVVVDRINNRVDMCFVTGFPHPHFFHMNTTAAYVRRVMPGLLADPKMRLFVGLLRDFIREPDDSPAILKGWTLLEVMASDEPGRGKEQKVRSLCRRMNVAPDAIFLAGRYAPGDDLLAAAYRHRNCVAHEGWCRPDNQRCRQDRADSPCRLARPLRADLQLFLFGLVADYLGATTSAAISPDGVRLVDKAGLFEPAVRSPHTRDSLHIQRTKQ